MVVHDEMQADELESERVDTADDAVEGGLVHELSMNTGHTVLGSELELRKRRP